MTKIHTPTTPAIRFLKDKCITFEPYNYVYQAHGGTHQSAEILNVDEHLVIKTIVLKIDTKDFIIVLMHGDRKISTKELARFLKVKHINPASEKEVLTLTGYQKGGCSPFGTKKSLPIYVENSIYKLENIYINGGKRGLQVKINPLVLKLLQRDEVNVAIEK